MRLKIENLEEGDLFTTKNGPSGNRTRVFGFEAQKDILYPMGPHRVIK